MSSLISFEKRTAIDLFQLKSFFEELNFVEQILKMSQTLRKISEKKLIKEEETNFKLVGILVV